MLVIWLHCGPPLFSTRERKGLPMSEKGEERQGEGDRGRAGRVSERINGMVQGREGDIPG